MEVQELFTRLDKLRDDLLCRMDNLSVEFREQMRDHKSEIKQDINKLWDDQRRQDECALEISNRKTSCLNDMDHKIELSNSTWWKRFAVICSILMSIIGSSFLYITSINNQMTKYQERIRTELEGIKLRQTECNSKLDIYSSLLQSHLYESAEFKTKNLNIK